jgi:type VI secretion system protein ImpE
MIMDGKYYWVPVGRFKQIAFDAPEDLRDLVWLPAHITWTNGGEAVGLMPVRYPGSEESARDPIRLARETVWTEPRSGRYEGSGQRMLATDGGDFPLLELRELLFLPEGEADGRAHTA